MRKEAIVCDAEGCEERVELGEDDSNSFACLTIPTGSICPATRFRHRTPERSDFDLCAACSLKLMHHFGLRHPDPKPDERA